MKKVHRLFAWVRFQRLRFRARKLERYVSEIEARFDCSPTIIAYLKPSYGRAVDELHALIGQLDELNERWNFMTLPTD